MKAANNAAFADDTGLITHSTDSMQRIMDGPLRKFCEYTLMEINISKTFITGIDFKNGKDLDTSKVTWEGGPLKSVPSSYSLKYLGVHIRLDGKWTQEKTYVLGKIRKATQILRDAKLTRKQTMAFLGM